MTDPFAPTHCAPATGLDTWDEPDATQPAGPGLPGGLPVQQVQQRGDWTEVACSNGWVAWVDGRRLEPLPATTPWSPTHLVPAAGLDAWAEPDPSVTAAARLDPRLDVQVVDQRGAWARIMCSNGWSAWVDGSRLEEVTS